MSIFGSSHLFIAGVSRDESTNPNIINYEYPLHKAAHQGNLASMEQLIQDGTSVNENTYDNVTPLHDACLAGHTQCVELLLEAGANVDACNIDGSTSLCDAANNGNIECIKLLLLAGASVNPPLNYTSPLHEAVLRDHSAVSEILILNGANINANDLHFGTPLHIVALKSYMESARVLIRLGADVNAVKMHQTPLHVAARQDVAPMVELLLDAGAKLKAENNWGHVAKHLCPRGHLSRDLLEFYDKNPFTLMHWSRIAIRKYIGPACLRQLPELKLPSRLTMYLEYRV